MRDDHSGGGGERRPQGMARFSGWVAVATDQRSATKNLTIESIDDEPWAIDIDYIGEAGRPLLSVRSVRMPPIGGLVRAETVEGFASALINFRHRQENSRIRGSGSAIVSSPNPADVAAETQRDIGRSRLRRREIDGLSAVDTVAHVDEQQVQASRVTVDDDAVLRIATRGQVFFCVGATDLIADLHLRLVHPTDVEDDPTA